MHLIPMAFSWASGLSDGVTTFGTIASAALDNPLISGVTMAVIVISLVGLVWGTFKH